MTRIAQGWTATYQTNILKSIVIYLQWILRTRAKFIHVETVTIKSTNTSEEIAWCKWAVFCSVWDPPTTMKKRSASTEVTPMLALRKPDCCEGTGSEWRYTKKHIQPECAHDFTKASLFMARRQLTSSPSARRTATESEAPAAITSGTACDQGRRPATRPTNASTFLPVM